MLLPFDCSSDCQQSHTTKAHTANNMATTVNKVDNFLEAFPNKIIKHTGRPDYEILNNIKTALKRNFATVPCTLGGGAHGYLGVILPAAEYAATPINTPPFVDPLFPGAAAVIPPNSTGPQISAIERQFNKMLRQWTEYKNLTDSGKKFIQDGIDDMYLKGITDRNVSLANITIREILEFLFQNYGNITQYDIEDNDKNEKKSGMPIAPLKCSSIKSRRHKTLHQPLDNRIPTTNYSPRPTISSTLRDSSSMIAKPGIVFMQNKKTMDNFKTTFQQAQ